MHKNLGRLQLGFAAIYATFCGIAGYLYCRDFFGTFHPIAQMELTIVALAGAMTAICTYQGTETVRKARQHEKILRNAMREIALRHDQKEAR